MRKSLFTLLVFISFSTIITAQEDSKLIDLSKTVKFIDTLLIDRDLNNWSIRSFASIKQQRFVIKSDSNKYSYKPNNPYGFGFGVGTKKITLDFGFNIKASEANPTERYDMVWSFFKENHLVEFYFKHYKGFDVINENSGEIIFREDILSLSTALSYMYMFNEAEYSIASMKSGLVTAEKSIFSFGLGGFIMYSSQRGNNAIIPNDIEAIERFQGTGIGLRLGFSSLFVLPKNFFLSFNASPGIGMMSKYVNTIDSGYNPKKPIVTMLGLSMVFGYNAEQYYVNLALTNGSYATDFNLGDAVIFSYLNAKLVFGYKLKGKIKKNWKK